MISVIVRTVDIQIYLAVTTEIRPRLMQLRLIVYLHVNVY